jgi:putative SOS response-associated peptidase YedK
MCVNYVTVSKQTLAEVFDTRVDDYAEWREELYRDYLAPIIVKGQDDRRSGLLANYGLIPKKHMPPERDYSTMNARAETVGSLRTYKKSWSTCQFCLIPMQFFFEPNYEAEKHVRWKIGMKDESPFAVAGIYREWGEADGSISHAFTQLTINADDHPLMNRFHKPDEEKRQLVIIPKSEYDDWLWCDNPEIARSFLLGFEFQLMSASPAPKVAVKKPEKSTMKSTTQNQNLPLF